VYGRESRKELHFSQKHQKPPRDQLYSIDHRPQLFEQFAGKRGGRLGRGNSFEPKAAYFAGFSNPRSDNQSANRFGHDFTAVRSLRLPMLNP